MLSIHEKKNRELTDTFKQKILEVLQVSIDFSNNKINWLPYSQSKSQTAFEAFHSAAWQPKQIPDRSNNNKKIIIINLPFLFNFKDITPTKITWESNFCECLICETARVKGFSKSPVSSSESKKKNVLDQYIQKMCSNCFSITRRGIPHSYNKTSLYQNLVEVASKDKLIAGVIAKKSTNNFSIITKRNNSPQSTKWEVTHFLFRLDLHQSQKKWLPVQLEKI